MYIAYCALPKFYLSSYHMLCALHQVLGGLHKQVCGVAPRSIWSALRCAKSAVQRVQTRVCTVHCDVQIAFRLESFCISHIVLSRGIILVLFYWLGLLECQLFLMQAGCKCSQSLFWVHNAHLE
jgi:hypothetical protein